MDSALNKRDLDLNKSQHDFEQEVNKGAAADRQQFAVQLERINTRAAEDRLETKLAIEKSNNKIKIMLVVGIVAMVGLYILVLFCADPSSPLGKFIFPAVMSHLPRGV